jgi:hypothetical protein
MRTADETAGLTRMLIGGAAMHVAYFGLLHHREDFDTFTQIPPKYLVAISGKVEQCS